MFNTKIALRTLLFALLVAGLGTTGCKKDEDTKQENITRIVVRLSGAGGFSQSFTWSDPDGGDASNATVQPIVIPASAGATLTALIEVYDDTKTPVENLTEEIIEEKNEHLFTFTVTGANLGIAYDDQDGNGKAFGQKTVWTKGAASAGAVKISLYHEPSNKDNLASPGGELDATVDFPVTIQ